MSSQLEQIRLLHSDVENATKCIVFEIQHKAKTQRRTVYQNHRIAHHQEVLQKDALRLLDLYEDEDGFRRTEIDALTGTTLQKTIANFDTRLAEIREYHKRFPANRMETADIPLEDQERKLQEELEEKIVFSGEESYGKYVDLHSFYLEYINMPQFERVEYLMFLHQFHHFHTIPRNKKNNHYKVYLNKLHAYFVDFYKRTQPLADITAILKQTESQFDVNWARGIILGWERNQLNLDKPTPVEKKEEKQGGGKRKRKRGKGKSNPEEEDKSIALCEARVERFVELLGDIIEATKIQIEKKQTRTWEEIQADFEREEQLEQHALELELQAKNIRGENSEEENKYASAAGSNPLNLPLGWDGKPIPYWLYKLHGLGNEYKCEICGNYSYWGPRAFERHFQEWRHANGMRCLKIPNTRHFHHVTKISDALELWEKIRMQADEQNWKSDAMEEYEDKDGNVFNKKTYEDLKRQGYLNQ